MQIDHSTEPTEPTVPDRMIWARTIAITALAAVGLEVCIVLYGTLSWLTRRTSHSQFAPWTFHTLWELAFLACVGFSSTRLGTKAGNFFAAIFLGGLVSGILWVFIPNSLVLPRSRYYGVESRITMEQHEAG